MRLALAPVYADAELGLPRGGGQSTDLGLGLSGGGLAFGQTEIVRGDERRDASFIGHGGGPSFSVYPRLGKLGPAPLNAVARLSGSYAVYERTASTPQTFLLPDDGWTGEARAGLRWGGQEPGLDRSPAAEVSAWWESRLRQHAGTYGFHDRVARRQTNLFWARILFDYAVKSGTVLGGGFSAGGSTSADRFSAYRLGGMLTMTSEFPLPTPGYYFEVIAQRYARTWLRLGALFRDERFFANLFATGAAIAPVQGTQPGGLQHAGLGAGLGFTPRKGALRTQLSYGYAPTAARAGGRGGHTLALSLEVNFAHPRTSNLRQPQTQQGLRWLLGR